ncbi:adenosylcobinamide-phosphate synthase CbiB [Methyloceanibacter sp.]|uniref:adenosylcobinamide-phosphate synthase CbiB n=1 Tax=Methyloceanibacter sp. TaxID=1965321 RepID=UPI002D25D42F|nr:adenosylcobinamide-phosphate synthase CbiB [Methyloceanibacter sp.]HZP09349.1 adenosylcobinamide-phosphate synthase CbiB [Methyloceanibacter sp.]
MTALLTLLALLFEAMLGYPERVFRAIGHPVMWMGALVGALDRGLNREGRLPWQRKLAGVAALLILIAATSGVAYLIQHWLLLMPLGMIPLAALAGTLLAQRSLYAHVEQVAVALEDDGIEAARASVSHIVGRDTAALDEAGVARAAIESLAENFSDGVVAPAFWMMAGGLPGAAAYKAINTADSMIGHHSERYEQFGWASARLDDLVNLPASRLSALFLIIAAYLTPGASASEAFGVVLRDASRHRSPNAGYPEAAVAGALGLALAGPRTYEGKPADGTWIGEGRYGATADDIRAALTLYRRADMVMIGGVAIVALLVVILT